MFENARKYREEYEAQEKRLKLKKAEEPEIGSKAVHQHNLAIKQYYKNMSICQTNYGMIHKALLDFGEVVINHSLNRAVIIAELDYEARPKQPLVFPIPYRFSLVFGQPSRKFVSVEFNRDFSSLTVELEIGSVREVVGCEISEEELIAALDSLPLSSALKSIGSG
jgi:hypothetical protein